MKRKIFLDKISNYHTDVVKKIINEHTNKCNYSSFSVVNNKEESHNDIKNYNNKKNLKELDFSKYTHSRYDN